MSSVFKSAAAVLAVAAVAVGCAITPQVKSQLRDGADFSKYKTYALLPLPETGPASDPGMMLRIGAAMRASVAEGMSALGYRAADRDSADFTLNIRGESIPRTDVHDWGYTGVYTIGPSGRVYFPPYRDVTVRNYEEQSLIIEAYDNQSKELVWIGWLRRNNYGGEVTVDDVTLAVGQVLSKFPARTGATSN